jgi:hypothetical protein
MEIYFVINPYDTCVANKKIEGKQMTIFFHVDDWKLSHRKTKVMDIMISTSSGSMRVSSRTGVAQ